MSRSYRDKERLESRKADIEIGDALNSLHHDDLAQRYVKAKSTKTIYRFGNKRKTVAKEKIQARRTQRKKDNDINDY